MAILSDISPLSEWIPLSDNRLYIAGPCSIENQTQLAETVEGIAKTGNIPVLRAGVWKPRSRPGQFEGRGPEAFAWLKKIRKETGLRIAVEVARPDHAIQCLEHEVDIIWLGARTTVNPFMVQEIADAISGTGIPVMIKNPVSPDLGLWIGAIERIQMAGSNKLIAIHRGFKTHKKSVYRNIPLWDIPLELRREIPGIPLICDPSHIAGNTALLEEVARQALTLSMDGLMVEVHHRPQKALTDREQQITPKMMDEMVSRLPDISHQQKEFDALEDLRRYIDETDHELLAILAHRMGLSRQIGELKKLRNEEILQPDRLKDLFSDRRQKGEILGIDLRFLEKFLHLLHEESVRIQSESASYRRESTSSNSSLKSSPGNGSIPGEEHNQQP
ncbi:MAG: chorismate mutase [Bacteroidales bacterium]